MANRFFLIIIIFSLIACNKSEVENVYVNHKTDTFLSPSSDTPVFLFSKLIDSTITKNIRMIEFKFKVNDVVKTTDEITEIAQNHGGYISRDNLTSQISKITKTPISIDSTAVVTYYTISNTILIRVLNSEIDSTVKEISTKIDFLDFKFISVDDRVMEILSLNEKVKNSNKDFTKKIYSEEIEELYLNKSSTSDYSKVFSAIIVSFYQNPSIKIDRIASKQSVTPYRANFNSKALNAFSFSIGILESCLLFLLRYWPFIMLIAIIAAVYFLSKKNKLGE